MHPRFEPDREGWAQRRVAFGMDFGEQRGGAGLCCVGCRIADFEPCDKPPGDIGQHRALLGIDATASDERLQPHRGFAQIAARLGRCEDYAAHKRDGERIDPSTGGYGTDDQPGGRATYVRKMVGDSLPGVRRQGHEPVEVGSIERPPQQRRGVGAAVREAQEVFSRGSPDRVEIENAASGWRVS